MTEISFWNCSTTFKLQHVSSSFDFITNKPFIYHLFPPWYHWLSPAAAVVLWSTRHLSLVNGVKRYQLPWLNCHSHASGSDFLRIQAVNNLFFSFSIIFLVNYQKIVSVIFKCLVFLSDLQRDSIHYHVWAVFELHCGFHGALFSDAGHINEYMQKYTIITFQFIYI